MAGPAYTYAMRAFVAASRAEISTVLVRHRVIRPGFTKALPLDYSPSRRLFSSRNQHSELSDFPWEDDSSSARAVSHERAAAEEDETQEVHKSSPASTVRADHQLEVEQDNTVLEGSPHDTLSSPYEDLPDDVDDLDATPSSSDSSLPWYLQQDTTPVTANPFADRQRLPDLPSHPPPILSGLLNHISRDLGLDDLSLLDLRTLDPPAALGSNLIMLIGTARSEKHLHVSADRLCRWLRSEHSLHPYADGLLGRNELKVRLRRKAKRAKLLSSVGAKARDDTNESVRTEWVCVNIGQVEGGDLPAEQGKMQDENFVGFSTETSGSRLVVQMMTDAKRGIMDLESLWTGILRRSSDRANEIEKGSDVVPVDKSVNASGTASADALRGLDSEVRHSSDEARA